MDSAMCMQVYGITDFFCYGPELGPNEFSLWVKSPPGSTHTVNIKWAKISFDFEYLEDGGAKVQVLPEWTRANTSAYPGLLINVEDEVDRVMIRLVPSSPILVAYPEFLCLEEAGIRMPDATGSHLPDLRIVPNPVPQGMPLRITATGRIDVYDVLGRWVSGTMPRAGGQDIIMSTSGLTPGIYFISSPSCDRRPAKVVVYK